MAKDAGGNRGASMNALETTPARRKRDRKRRAAQESRWAAKAGPVTVTFVEPDEPKDETKPEPASPA